MLRSTKFNLNSKLLVKPFYSKVYNIINIFFYQQNIKSGNKIWKTNQCLMQHVVKLRMMVCNYLEGFPCHHLYCALSMQRMSDVLMLAYNTKRIALHHYPCFFQLSKYRETNAQIKFFRSYLSQKTQKVL